MEYPPFGRKTGRAARWLASGLFSWWLTGLSPAADLHADAAADFSSEQGNNSWRYQLWNPSGSLHELPFWDAENKQWKEGDGAIWAGGMHPHSTTWYVVREWTSPESGAITISGSVALGEDAAGVTLKILKDYNLNAAIWSADLTSNQSANFFEKTQVKKGDRLVFAIIGQGGIRKDATAWAIDIIATP